MCVRTQFQLSFFIQSTCSVSTKLTLHSTLSTLEQCHSVRSLCQQHGHRLGAHQKCRISGLAPGPLYQQEESVNSPRDSDTHFKAVSDWEGRGSVCVRITWGSTENTPARALHLVLQGKQEEVAEASATQHIAQ